MILTSAPGVTLERRSLLALPAFVALTPRLSRRTSEAALDFEAFTEICGELASAHLENGRALPEALLLRLAEAGARLQAATVPRPKLGAFGGYEPTVSFAPVHRAPPIFVIQWKLEPNAILPAHNHTPAYVVSLCLEGECRVQHFEIVGEAPPAGKAGAFRTRETRAQLLRPGHTTSLTPERDNIHTFQAGPRGAFGIDINVSLPGEGDWSMLAQEEGTRDGFERLHDARWIGKPKR